MSETPQPTGSLLVPSTTLVVPSSQLIVPKAASPARIENLDEIGARIDGMYVKGNFVGLMIVQAANDPADPPTFIGNLSNFLLRRSAVPGVTFAGVAGEDFATPGNVMPGANLSGVNLTRWNGANTSMPGSSLVDAVTPRANLQKVDLSDSDVSGWQAVQAFLEESRIVGIRFNDGTNLEGAHLADAIKTGVQFSAVNVKNADFGPDGIGKGNLRSSSRKSAAAEQASQRNLG